MAAAFQGAHGVQQANMEAAEAAALERLDADAAMLWEESDLGAAPALPAGIGYVDMGDMGGLEARAQAGEEDPPPSEAVGITSRPAVAAAAEWSPPLKQRRAAASRHEDGRATRLLPAGALGVLSAWLWTPEHFAWPYPSGDAAIVRRARAGVLHSISGWPSGTVGEIAHERTRARAAEERETLSAAAGITVRQTMNWLTNARKRVWKVCARAAAAIWPCRA